MSRPTTAVRHRIYHRVLGRRVAARRRQLKLTQETVADRVGLQRTSIANIETGRHGRISVGLLFDLADALACEPAALLPVRLSAPLEGEPMGPNYGGLRRNGGCAPPDGLCERPARSIDPPAPSAPSGAQASEPPSETEDTEEPDGATGVTA